MSNKGPQHASHLCPFKDLMVLCAKPSNALSGSKTGKFSFSLSSGRSGSVCVYVCVYFNCIYPLWRAWWVFCFLVFLFLGYKQLCVINRFFEKKLAWSGQLQMGTFLTGVLYTSGVGGRLPAIGWWRHSSRELLCFCRWGCWVISIYLL